MHRARIRYEGISSPETLHGIFPPKTQATKIPSFSLLRLSRGQITNIIHSLLVRINLIAQIFRSGDSATVQNHDSSNLFPYVIGSIEPRNTSPTRFQ